MQIPGLQLILSACWSLECRLLSIALPDVLLSQMLCAIFPAYFISSISGGKLSDAPSHAERCASPVLSSLSGPARRQTVVIINCTLLRGLLPALSASAQLFKGSLHCCPLPATALERERLWREGERARADSQGQDTGGGVKQRECVFTGSRQHSIVCVIESWQQALPADPSSAAAVAAATGGKHN